MTVDVFYASPFFYSLVLLGALTALLAAQALSGARFAVPSYVRYLWGLLLVLNVAEGVSFTLAIWMLAVFSFQVLREYFSLVDIRLQDRWGILGAYLSIPFMTYLIQIDWYGMFIISIPVYVFLVIPLLIALGGGDVKGTVFSVGAIDFGLFLFVYCLGHIGYLALFSTWMAALLVVGVALCDLVSRSLPHSDAPGAKGALLRFLASSPLTVGLSLAMSGWTAIPVIHATMLGLLLPVLVLAGNFAIAAMESDLGIAKERLLPGRGQIIHGVKSYLFAAPVVFHYIRYFVF